jgi:hypothetical protein
MKKLPALLLFATMPWLSARLFASENPTMPQLAQDVWKAAGGEHWPNVKSIDFTFAVEKNGTFVMQAEHHWDVAAQTDQVKWKGKNVTVNLADPAQDENGKAAYARWVNDSYWLLAPLKLKDRGVSMTDEGTKEVDGAKRQVLRLSFEKVGLTPNDQYRLYIDPETKLVTAWDYMPKGSESMHCTWDDYQSTGGLMLATNHKMAANTHIRILNLKVTSAK